MQDNKLAQTFIPMNLILYSIPTIIMMVLNSTYGIIDGLFISNFVGEDALAATNIAFPVILIAIAIGLMMATGANAIIGKLLGERKEHQARELLSFIYIVAILASVTISTIILVFADEFLTLIGANAALLPLAKEYLVAAAPFLTFILLQIFTQIFLVTAGKPIIGFAACLIGGITNIVLDYVLIVSFDLGLTGAALATGTGYSVGGIFGFLYFLICRRGSLYFVKPRWNFRQLAHSLYNGMSEFVSSTSGAITTVLFNIIMMQIAGESGVAGITVIMYVSTILSAMYMGYSMGVSPVISYKFGAQAHEQLQLINKTSKKVIAVISIVTVVLSIIFAEAAVGIFISPESATFALTVHGFRIYAIAFLFMGFNVFISAMFTALSNGRISAIVSVSRTLVFIVTALVTLPFIFGINGVWVAVPVAEALGIIVSLIYFKKYKRVYNY
ncbi:MATE family efflux transporter [Candidatus Epulonipiscium viviparus]|uniref:MATE family efflux transporter n=1 Tax=Candidatus Epulonipiscium viviparus TaxID=420336 RepID=UPI00273808C3|nr:MATE family efflux transporter [Candidatus Epulopiscium viviparus]